MEWTREERYRRINDISEDEYKNLELTVKNSPYRQKFHIQPKTGLLNDPNGFSYFNGEYHLFYQWFPLGPVHGVKYWYHMTSKDLVFWNDKGIALEPDTKYDSHGVFSGSGYSTEDKLYLFYTGNVRDENWVRNSYQCIAIMDKDGNIVKNDFPFINGIPEGYTEHFRDPKIFKKDNFYYCVIGAENNNNKGTIVYYRSNNLKNWEKIGEIKTNFNENSGFIWECPDYFEQNEYGVLLLSPQGMNPVGDLYNNIFQSGYLLGKKLNFENGTFEHNPFKEFDRGFEFYAPQTMLDPNGKRILIGWFGLPGIDSVTDEFGWAHCLTIPRVLEIKNGVLYQNPIPELSQLIKNEKTFSFSINNEEKYVENNTRCYNLKVNFNNISSKKFGIKFRVGENEETLFYYDLTNKKLIFNRENSGILMENFEGGNIRKCDFEQKELHLNIFLDESSVEIFVNNGLEVFSSRLFNNINSNNISFFSDGKININGTMGEI